MPDEITPAAAPVVESAPSLLAGVESAPVAAAASPSYVNADGSFTPGWLDSLGPELKGNATLSTVPTLKDLANSYLATKSLVGKKLQAPSETSTPEEVAAWRKTVGAPETPEGYGELRPDDFPADQWDPAPAAALAQIAHKHHLPPSAVKEIVGLHTAQVKAALEKYTADEATFKVEGLATLRKEWGADFEGQAHAAKTFAKAIGLDPGETPEFASPAFVLAMARGAKMIMGDRAVAGAPVSISGGVESRIHSIRSSPEYNGERGQEAQMAAQKQLHDLYAAKQQSAA